jgi:peroxiredoxin
MTPPSEVLLGRRLGPGDAAPDWTVVDAEARPVALSSLWQRGPVVLTFLRHFG